jgi:hypothetical protein
MRNSFDVSDGQKLRYEREKWWCVVVMAFFTIIELTDVFVQ